MKNVRKVFSIASAVALAIILLASAATSAHAQTFTVLYNFGGVAGDPQHPYYGPIVQGTDGNLYATTTGGGSTGSGTVFKITPNGALTVLSNLGGNAGYTPYGGLTLGRDGNLYGTATDGGSGGAGTVFQIAPDGKLRVLYSFAEDYVICGAPHAPPTQGADGNLYGTTYQLGACYGTIYKIAPPLHLTTLYQFSCCDHSYEPQDPLLQATDGNFYGTTNTSAFKISAVGAFTSLGLLPGSSIAPLVQANDGSFYGVTNDGGTHGVGAVYQMNRSWKVRVLHSLDPANEGIYPIGGLVQATDGNFYGTTQEGGALGAGTIYRLSPTGDSSVIYHLDDAHGCQQMATLVQHTTGLLYGEASSCGLYGGGVFFSLDIGAPSFVRLVTTFGKAGKTIGILGQGFTGATGVSFNGMPATYTVSSDTYLEATVPAGATTGFVTVTTSTGTLTSNQQIQIRQ